MCSTYVAKLVVVISMAMFKSMAVTTILKTSEIVETSGRIESRDAYKTWIQPSDNDIGTFPSPCVLHTQ
jgi:hypothetical protein